LGVRYSGCFRYLFRCLASIVIVLAVGCICARLYFLCSCRVVLAPYHVLVKERADEKDVVARIAKPWHTITSEEGSGPAGDFRPYEETGIRVPGKVFVYPETICGDYGVVYVFINRAGKVFDVKLIML